MRLMALSSTPTFFRLHMSEHTHGKVWYWWDVVYCGVMQCSVVLCNVGVLSCGAVLRCGNGGDRGGDSGNGRDSGAVAVVICIHRIGGS